MERNSNLDGLLLELAVSIGVNTGCDLLKFTIPLFVEKLNCSGAAVFRCNYQSDLAVSVCGLSKNEHEFLETKAGEIYRESFVHTHFNLVKGQSNEYHVLLLSDFGFIALCFRETPGAGFIQKLLPVINHLAKACQVSEKLNSLCSENEAHCQEKSLLNAVIQNIPDPVYVKDLEGRKIILNMAEAELLGKSTIEEVIGKKDSDFYPEAIASKTEEEDHLIIETGKPFIHRDGILTMQSGREMWVQGTKIPHFDQNGKVSGIIGISHDISEYKKIENEVRVVAEKYQAIFNSFVDLYYRADLNGTILELSPSVYQLSGYKPEELVGRSVTQVYANIEERNRMIKILVKKGYVNDFENLLIHKNGEHIPVSITCHLVKNSEDEKSYIEGTIRNISERKESEEKLNRLLSLQNLLTHFATEFINIPVESSNEAIDRLLSVIGGGNEIDHVFVFEYDFAQNTMSNTHEWCAGDITPLFDNLQQIPNKLLPSWVEAHQKGEILVIPDVKKLDINDPQYIILGTQDIRSFVSVPIHVNDECIGFACFGSVSKVKEWSPDEIIFLKIMADLVSNVTNRKRKDEALRNREASLKAIFNNVPFQMWLKDVDSNYLSVNKPFIDYFSINSESEIIGKNALDIWEDDVALHFIEQDKLVMEKRELISTEELVEFKNKSVWFEIFRAPIIDQYGQLLGTTGIARDITSRKMADKALQLAVKKAESATRAKSMFLAIMSHEIRNPLNAVVGMVRMLHEAGNNGQNSTLIENIKTSSDHLLMIINDVLDFSKIESGDMVLEKASFDIHDVVKRVFNSNAFIAKEKQLDLRYYVDNRIGHSQIGDPLRLQQVLGNLVSNALKFTPYGKIEIRCELESQSGNDLKIRFEVVDTGIGIDSLQQETIFESFKQENDTISRTHGGSGLGLAISKQIVELMGGKLSVRSEKNEGSKFYFTVTIQNDENGTMLHPPKKENPVEDSLNGYSVLLVEDNKLNQILATTLLTKWGARVVVACDGQQAIDTVTTDSFDIILMDIQMPVMDGMTASLLMREKFQVKTPILALSANVIKGITERCMEAGMQGYISKPFDPNDLYNKIIQHAQKSVNPIDNQDEPDPDIVVVDISRLEKMIGSDPVQLHIMINKFLEITPAYLDELNDADKKMSLEAIFATSHKIKSSIDLVSSQVLRDLILNINQASRSDGDIQAVRALIRKFNRYYRLLEVQLRQEISTIRMFKKVS